MTDTVRFWQLCNNGTAIRWIPAETETPHYDHVELAGKETALVIYYGVNADSTLSLELHCIYPMLRLKPNVTVASFQADLKEEDLPALTVNGETLKEFPESFLFNGVLTIISRTSVPGLRVKREIFPTDNDPVNMIRLTLCNEGTETLRLDTVNNHGQKLDRGARGVYILNTALLPEGGTSLAPGAETTFALTIQARTADQKMLVYDSLKELQMRLNRVKELTAPMQLETGIAELDAAFYFCKIRAGESIFRTRGGYMHGPGGERYYAATWCNDELEYAGPWFAWTGDALALEASFNAYCHYMPFMGPDYRAIPSSIISEGIDFWEGAGDRGDAAMYAYGASRFALTCGNREIAEKLWRGIEWCLEYCRRNLNEEGVVRSDSDEMENRFESGSFNLCTSSLYYGALKSAAAMAEEFGENKKADLFRDQAKTLRINMEKYFGAELHGFKTYRYCDGNTTLRSWIGIPLCMGIFDRAEDTVNALYSDYLWFYDGMLTEEGSTTYWDRSLLYGLRGAFASGVKAEQTWQKLLTYTEHRLLGDHVPYPIEAWPEGEKRHLSAESALYCRVITEGMLGLEPASSHSFRVAPHLPEQCGSAALREIRAFGEIFDLTVDRESIKVTCRGITKIYPAEGGLVDLAEF